MYVWVGGWVGLVSFTVKISVGPSFFPDAGPPRTPLFQGRPLRLFDSNYQCIHSATIIYRTGLYIHVYVLEHNTNSLDGTTFFTFVIASFVFYVRAVHCCETPTLKKNTSPLTVRHFYWTFEKYHFIIFTLTHRFNINLKINWTCNITPSKLIL